MEMETLFTTSKWDILKNISKKSNAPLGIANTLNLTIANVSQQLRLLEAAGLVKKQRIANVGAGQPRALFSLTHNFAYLSLVSDGLTKKKLLKISGLQIFVARTWLLDNPRISNILTKFAYSNETFFNKIGELYFLSADSSEVKLEVISKKKVSIAPTSFKIDFEGKTMKIVLKCVSSPSEGSELLFNESLLSEHDKK